MGGVARSGGSRIKNFAGRRKGNSGPGRGVLPGPSQIGRRINPRIAVGQVFRIGAGWGGRWRRLPPRPSGKGESGALAGHARRCWTRHWGRSDISHDYRIY